MGISHSTNQEQKNQVLTQFDATMTAMGEIEQKVVKMRGYMETVRQQRHNIELKAKQAAASLDNLGEGLENRSDEVLEYFTRTLETIAGVVEQLEGTIAALKIQEMPRGMQREFGPLLVPAIVLVLIITSSNCYFGFLLAEDEVLSQTVAVALIGAPQMDELQVSAPESDIENINILKLFAIFHVSLLGAAFSYLLLEGCKALKLWRHIRCRRCASPDCSEDEASDDTSHSGTDSQASRMNDFPNSDRPVSSVIRRMCTVTNELSSLRKQATRFPSSGSRIGVTEPGDVGEAADQNAQVTVESTEKTFTL